MSVPGGRVGGAAGIAAAVLIAAGLAALPDIPDAGADPQAVYAFFLDEGADTRVGAALLITGLIVAAALLSTLRLLFAEGGAPATGAAVFSFGILAVGAQAFALATLIAPAVRPESADPATSRALLDLFEIGTAISGIAFAFALATSTLAIRRSEGILSRRIAELSIAAAIDCALWAGRLLTDAGLLAADSVFGATLGWILLMVWLLSCGLWLFSRRPEAEA